MTQVQQEVGHFESKHRFFSICITATHVRHILKPWSDSQHLRATSEHSTGRSRPRVRGKSPSTASCPEVSGGARARSMLLAALMFCFVFFIQMLLHVISLHRVLLRWVVCAPKFFLSRCKRRTAKLQGNVKSSQVKLYLYSTFQTTRVDQSASQSHVKDHQESF